MRESEKSNQVRPPEFFTTVLAGRVIDIGCGDDPVTPTAEGFDVQDGDANEILRYREPASYDCVYSSHCLEHMHDPNHTLPQWWALVKPGGHLVVVVPHEDLYEQGYWPSLFNGDHKATFRVGGESSWSPVSVDIQRLVGSLPRGRIVSIDVHDRGYDHRLRASGRAHTLAMRRLNRWLIRRAKRGGVGGAVAGQLLRAVVALGAPVDQTSFGALAQIQVVAVKV